MAKWLVASLVLLPMLAFAVETGFPSQAIWVSKTSAVEGDTLVISTVVHNGDDAALQGTLVFLANDARIGAREFDLGSGESQIHSIEWKPSAGSYDVAAEIEGTSAELTQRKTPAIALTVAAPPSPSPMQETTEQVIGAASTIASSSIPVVLGAAKSVFNAIEPYRQAGVEKLENYIESSRAMAGTIAGTSTSNTEGFDSASEKSGPGIMPQLLQTAAAAALLAFSNLYFFYPLLAFIVLGTLYWLAKRIRKRPIE